MLLARRHRYTGTISFFRCWSPTPVPLARLVWVVCQRWKIEEDFQTCNNATGHDKGQVTTWTSWHRWSTSALVAYAVLAVAAALERQGQGDGDTAGEVARVPISCRLLILPPPRRDAEHALRWLL